MPCHFSCCECGTHVYEIAYNKPPSPPICSACLYMPGWQGIPELRHILTGEAIEKPEMLDHDGESEQSE